MSEILIFSDATATHPIKQLRLQQFAAGIRSVGDSVTFIKGMKYQPCDVAIFLGAGPADHKTSPRMTFRRNIMEGQKRNNGKMIIIESQLIGRDNPNTRGNYYRVGFNHHLPDLTDFLNKNSPPDRWNDIVKQTGVDIQPWRQSGDHILLCGQIGGNANRGIDQREWVDNTISKIREVTDRKIILRPKKTNIYEKIMFKNYKNLEIVDKTKFTLDENLNNAWAMIVFTSTVSILSLIRGFPLFAGHPGCFGWEIANQDFKDIENPKMLDREQFLYDLAYAQWSTEEFQDGTVWKRLREQL